MDTTYHRYRWYIFVAVAVAIIFGLFMIPQSQATVQIEGDTNADGRVNITDVLCYVHMVNGQDVSNCLSYPLEDVDLVCDGVIDQLDVDRSIEILFSKESNPKQSCALSCEDELTSSPVTFPETFAGSGSSFAEFGTDAVTLHLFKWHTNDFAWGQFDFSSIDLGSNQLEVAATLLGDVDGTIAADALGLQFCNGNCADNASNEVFIPLSSLDGTPVSFSLDAFTAGTNFDPSAMRYMHVRLYGEGIFQYADLNLTLSVVDNACDEHTEEVPPPTEEEPPVDEPSEPEEDIGTNMIIDIDQTRVPFVDRGVLGGNTVDDRVADYFMTDLFSTLGGSDKPEGFEVNRPIWRVHMIDKGQAKNYMMYNPDLHKRDNCLYNPMILDTDPSYTWKSQYPEPFMDMTCDGENYYEIEWFDRSPTYGERNRHALSYTKNSPGLLKHRLFNYDNTVDYLPVHNTYARFDFQLSSDIPFSVSDAGAVVASSPKFRVVLNADKTVDFYLGDVANEILIHYPTPLNDDEWYSFEMFIDGSVDADANICNEATAAELEEKGYNALRPSMVWVNGKSVKRVKGAGLRADCPSLSTEIQFGALSGAETDTYSFKIDEVEVRTKRPRGEHYPYATDRNDNKYTDDVLLAHNFENNVMTLLDYGVLAEQLNLELVLQLPNPCEVEYGCEGDAWEGEDTFRDIYSVAGSAAMIEYMTGVADADWQDRYDAIVADNWSLDGGHNWANLRAYHGRVEPFDLRFVEAGNEPYYYNQSYNGKTFTYHGNESGFAARTLDLCEAVKDTDADIACIIASGGSGSFDYDAVVDAMATDPRAELVDGFALHSYFIVYGQDRVTDYPFRTMAGSYAYKVHGDGSTYHSMNDLFKAKNQWSSELGGDHVFWLTEFNSILNNFKWTPTDQAIDAIYYASQLTFMLEQGVSGGAHFFWNGASFTEQWRQGFVGEYDLVPQVTLNGQIAELFATQVPWDGHVVNIDYDPLISQTEVDEGNGHLWAPKVTAVAVVSEAQDKLAVVVINRDTDSHAYQFNMQDLDLADSGFVHQLDAGSLTQTHQDIGVEAHPVTSDVLADYSFPGLSVTVLTFDLL